VNVVFFGSSDFSVPSLLALAGSARHHLAGVAAQPDRPSGRNRQIRRGAVHEAAAQAGIPIILPEKIGGEEAMRQLEIWQPDVIAVASFGQYIPTRVLRIPRLGVINVHPSLLPLYRGAAPMQWSIARGETASGITIFRVVKEMDAGDIIVQERHAIEPGENAVDLSARFSVLGAELMMKALDAMEDGTAPSIPQDHARATFAPKLNKVDGQLDWRRPARDLHNRIRGFQPWPGAWFVHRGISIKVWKSVVEQGRGAPGEVLDVAGPGPLIATGDQAVRLLTVQPEGKKIMPGAAFLCGHAWRAGDIMEAASTTSERNDSEGHG